MIQTERAAGERLAGGWRELAAVLAFGAVLAICLTYPFAVRMGHVGRADSSDGEFSIWNVAWVARTLVVDPRHVLDANIFYPHLRTLLYSETNLGAGALAIPAYWATGNPIFALNFVFLLSLVLSVTGAYYLVRYLVGDRRGAAVAAICFGFCPYVFAHTTHIQLLMTAGLPLSLLAFHRAADRPSARRGVVLGLSMAVQTAFCGYYAVFVILLVGFGTLAVPTLRGWWTNVPYWKMVAIAVLTAGLVASPLAVPYLQFQRGIDFHRDLSEAVRYSANLSAYLASNAVAHVWMLPLLDRFEHWSEVLFPGFVATLGGAAGLVLGWRHGGRLREITVIYGSITLLALWASFGPQAGLYTALYRVIPLFTSMRAPSRFGVVVALGLAVLTGVAVRDRLAHVAWASTSGVLLVILAAVDLAVPLTSDVFREVPPLSPAYALMRTLPAGPVIELPFWSKGSELHGHSSYMRFSVSHWMPLINGYSDYIPSDFIESAPTVQSFPSREAFQALATRHPRYAVFHMQIYGDEDRAAVFARLNEFAPYLAPLYIDDETRLYEIVKSPPPPEP
jgi:hypothetical protein